MDSSEKQLNTAYETPQGPDQPYLHGYNAKELKNWSPETDPYAKYFRSRVPLAKRIEPFQPTQAHPQLTHKAKVLNLSADYDKEEWFGAYRYNDSFSRHVMKFWQYQDIFGAWHGLPVYGSDEEELDHGVVNIPNPAYTDAAHKNGVLSLGCWFWPRNIEFGELLEKDENGTYIVANKMVEMAHYFGFDGYFINQEGAVSKEHAEELMEMLKYLREQGMYLSWYDCFATNGELLYVNGFNELNAPWVKDPKDGRQPNDSIFMNYAFTRKRLDDSAEYARSLGLDPYEALFAGIENDKFRFERGMELDAIFKDDEARTPRTSLSLFGTDMVWNRGPNQFDKKMQPHIEEREIMYWSGPYKNPTKTGRNPHSEALSWPGIAHYIPERSVIGSYPFVTRFNNGHGLHFFIDGEISNVREWNNIGIQDLLPTWQWWNETDGSGEPLEVSYDYKEAWNGGSSIKIEGNLGKDNPTNVRLFKTELPISENTELTLIYKLQGNHVRVQSFFLFKEDPLTPVYVDMDCEASETWQTTNLSLKEYVGKTIAMIGFRFTTEEEAKQATIHLGELKVTDGPVTVPKQPTGFQVEKGYYDDLQASLFLKWDFIDAENVWYYDIYCRRNNKREWIGRIYDEVYYVKSIELDGETALELELVAVGKDGKESEPTTYTWDVATGEKTEYQYGPFPVTEMGFHGPNELSLEVGWSDYLYVYARPSYATNIELTWTSSDESVAIVNDRGVVTGVGAGTAVITAQAGEINGEPGMKVEIPVTVVHPVEPVGGVTIQAENYDDSNGIFNPHTYLNVRDINFANWVAYHDIDFGEEGVSYLAVHAAVKEPETRMEIRLDGPDGKLVVDMLLEKKSGKGAPHYHLYQVKLPEKLTGKQTLHVTFSNPRSRFWQVRDVGIVDVDWFNFY